jgi:hypothetical protein
MIPLAVGKPSCIHPHKTTDEVTQHKLVLCVDVLAGDGMNWMTAQASRIPWIHFLILLGPLVFRTYKHGLAATLLPSGKYVYHYSVWNISIHRWFQEIVWIARKVAILNGLNGPSARILTPSFLRLKYYHFCRPSVINRLTSE